MRAQILWRKVHYWASIFVAAPILVVVVTGLLLQVKKDFNWIQPTEQRGVGGLPAVTFDQILDRCGAIPDIGLNEWTQVDRIDYRPSRSLMKVTTCNGWEIQLDPADGTVLQVARRRSDLIESLHDGSWFGDIPKRWIFLPSGVVLLLLWGTGIYLFLLPQLRRVAKPARQPPA